MTGRRARYAMAVGCVVLMACDDGTASLPDMQAQIGTRLAEVPEASGLSAKRAGATLTAGFAEALRTAVLASAAYQAAEAFEQEALANIGVAASALRPQLNARSTVGARREGPPVDDTITGASGDLSLTQVIYDGGAARSAIDGATASALAARASRVEQGNQIALDAARAWIDLWQTSERLALLRGKIGDLAALMDQMDRMAANGLMDRAAVESAKQQVLDIRLEQAGLENSLTDAQVRFAQFYLIRQSRIGRPDRIVTTQGLTARGDDWRTTPALERAAAELIAAERAQDEARAAFRPTVTVQAGVTSPLDDDDTTDINGGVSLRYVVGDGGRRAAVLDAATKRVAALQAGLSSTQAAERAERDAALAQLAALDRSVVLVTQKRRLSTSEAETARTQITTGQANLGQLISAEIASYRAADRLMQLQADIHVLQLTIAARSGYLTQVIGLEP